MAVVTLILGDRKTKYIVFFLFDSMPILYDNTRFSVLTLQ